MNFKYNISFLILFFCALVASAQLSEKGVPPSSYYALPPTVPVKTMPGISLKSLLVEDEADLASNLPLRFAKGFKVNYNLTNSGVWHELENGDRVWRLRIECPGAMNINFLYSDFFMPPGGQLFVYNEDKSQVIGAFTQQNNKPNRRFATALIHDDVAILEYIEPANVAGQGAIEIAQIAHGYRGLDGQTALEKAGSCQVNINCEEGANWQNEKKGVAKIIMDGLYLCSGTLVNNSAHDCKPYFSTANHCIDGGIKQDAIINPDVSGYVFYWNFEYLSCDASGILPEQTTSGGTVVASSGTTGQHTILSSDFALILLAENPRDQYDVYFNGFDASGNSGNGGVGIHHPAGDDKKISIHSSTPQANGYFWDLYWDPTPNGYSVTEGGSSGSPLFRENHLAIGQLFGGGSVNCDDPANDLAKYGMYSYSWTNEDDLLSFDARRRLHDWLDPIDNGNLTVVHGAYDPCETPRVYFVGSSATVAEDAANVMNGCRDYIDYEIQLKITPYPTQPVVATILYGGSASYGASADYEVLQNSVTFTNVINTGSIIVRVYDDAMVEGPEHINLSFAVSGTNGLTAVPLNGLNTYQINLTDNDLSPDSHVQSVRNDDYPAEAYLGPFETVHFFDPGTGGIMMTIENLSGHNYGCTNVAVDHAGASANNNWASGSTTAKTFIVHPEYNNANGSYHITLYYTNSEVQGWEWFNNQNANRNDLTLHKFPNAAIPANESHGVSTGTTMGTYGSDFTFSGVFSSGFSGFTVGSLSLLEDGLMGLTAPGVQLQNLPLHQELFLQLSPNPTHEMLKVSLTQPLITSGQLIVRNRLGQVVYEQALTEGHNEELRINVSDLPPAVYFLQVSGKDGFMKTERFVKY